MASVKVPNITTCPDCGAPKAGHKVCLACGTYNKRKVVEVPSEESNE
jgi:ribosomal protein L32